MDRLQLHHAFLRIIKGRISSVRYMKLMPLRIRTHVVLLAELIDKRHSLRLIPHGDPFDFSCHPTKLQISPQNPDLQLLSHSDLTTTASKPSTRLQTIQLVVSTHCKS